MRPVILISSGTQDHPLSRRRCLSVLYGGALASAGLLGAICTGGDPAGLADRFDGLLLSGGGDLPPALYGQTPDPRSNPPDPVRDAEELGLLAAFCAARKPVLGICRGIQVINIYFGGTLIQHLDGHADGVLHQVSTEPGSILRALCGPYAAVNSFHHQACDKIGAALRVTAHSITDGAIEGLEHASLPVLGVQWHPERMISGLCQDTPCNQSSLFAWFLRE